MSRRSCGLEVSREGLSSNSFFPARPAVWQVGSKKEGDVRARSVVLCRLRPKLEMHGMGSQKSAQISNGDDGEATRATAAAKRPGVMLEQHGDEINKREEGTKREEEEKKNKNWR